MKTKAISVEQLALETAKIVGQARKAPVLVKQRGKPTLVLRALSDDEVADDLLLKSPSFRASIRRGRARRAAGGGTSLAEARRRQLKL